MHFATQYTKQNTEIIELKNNAITAKIALNIGNSLFSLQKGDIEYLYFPFSFDEYRTNSKLAGNPFMHPWANRLETASILVENKAHLFPTDKQYLLYRDENNLPLHGLLLKSAQWKTIELAECTDFCFHIAEFIFDNEDLLSIFPFKHKIQLKHKLENDYLHIETTIINLDKKSMPISFGFHPYFFKSNKNNTLKIPTDTLIEVDEYMIPTGIISDKNKKWNFNMDQISLAENSFDDGFQDLKFENNNATFEFNALKILVDKNYPFTQIYVPQHKDKPYVCIEPMTAATNALNKKLCNLIKQNELFTATFSIVL